MLVVQWFREGRVPLQTLRADIDYSMRHLDRKDHLRSPWYNKFGFLKKKASVCYKLFLKEKSTLS